MEPGLVAIVIWMAVLILWWSGWRQELSSGLPEWGVTLFLVLWPFAFSQTFSFGEIGGVNLAFSLILWAALLASVRITAIRRWTLLAAGLLIGSITLFLSKLSLVVPALMAANPRWYIAVLIGTAAVLLIRSPLEQWVAITIGFALSAIVEPWLRQEPRAWFVLGDSEWMATWWLAIVSSKSLSYIAQRVAAVVERFNLRKGGERS